MGFLFAQQFAIHQISNDFSFNINKILSFVLTISIICVNMYLLHILEMNFMYQDVQDYIKQMKVNQLISKGLYRKEKLSEEEIKKYKSDCEIDKSVILDDFHDYVRIIPLSVSDEEFEQILKLDNAPSKPVIKMHSTPILSGFMYFFGVVILIMALIFGISLETAFRTYSDSFNVSIMLMCWCSGAFFGFILFAGGKIVSMIDEIKCNICK